MPTPNGAPLAQRPLIIAGALITALILVLAAGAWWSGSLSATPAHVASASVLAGLSVAALRGAVLARQSLIVGVSSTLTLVLLRALHEAPIAPGVALVLAAAASVLSVAMFATLAPSRTTP